MIKTIKVKDLKYDTEKQAVFLKKDGSYLIRDGVEWLDLDKNKITKIENIPDSVKELWLSDNQITKIENIPESVEWLYLDNNPIKTITKKALNLIKKNKIRAHGVDVDNLKVE